MCPISDGQAVNASNSNAVWLDAQDNDTAFGEIGFHNTNPGVGFFIDSTQKLQNNIADVVGLDVSGNATAENDTTGKTYSAPAGTIADGDTHKEALKKLADKFDPTSGHKHTGTTGDAPPVSASDLDNFNNFFSDWQTDTFAGAVGFDDDVTSVFSALTPGGGPSSFGIPTTAPYNKTELRTSPSEDQIETPDGRKVYGRLTESSGTWTLTYYYEDSLGVETAYSLPSQDIRIYWREVFSAATRPTFGTTEGFIGSLDATADVVDASVTQRGAVSTGTQSFAGVKTFSDGAVFEKSISTEKTDVSAGGSIAALTSTYSFVRITGTGPTTIQGVTAPSTAKRIVVHNASNDDVVLSDEDAGATAANRFTLVDGNDITIAQYSSAEIIYDLSAARWKVASSGSGTGSSGYQESLGTGDGVTTTFGPLSQLPVSEASIEVYLNSLIIEDSLWSLSGSDIVFSTAPAASQNVYVWYLTTGAAAPISLTTGAVYVDEHQVTAGEITAKEFTLTNTPVSASTVALFYVGGSVQLKTIDYIVTGGNKINWSGLGLESLLIAGDYLVVTYVY